MIVRPMESWFRMLFAWHGSVLRSIIPQLVFIAAFSTLAVWTHGRVFGEKIPLSTTPFTLFGLALAIFLAFRNNVSFARYDEARHLWGNVLIASRALTSQVLCYLPDGVDRGDRLRLVHGVIAFAYALKHQLRKSDPMPDITRLLGAERAGLLRQKSYKPAAILNDLRASLATQRRDELTANTTLWLMDAQISELGRTLGGCERILSTPIPFAYSVLLHRTAYAYCILLPFGLVDSTEFITPLLCVFIAYTLIGLEAIANEVGEPFGLAPNALALDAITRTIERSLLELCGSEMPAEVTPERPYVLT